MRPATRQTARLERAVNSENMKENWAEVCALVKTYNGVDASQATAFFSRLQPQAMSEGFLMLTADNDFIKSWIERHYLELIKRALIDIFSIPFVVVVEVDPTQAAGQNPGAQAQGEGGANGRESSEGGESIPRKPEREERTQDRPERGEGSSAGLSGSRGTEVREFDGERGREDDLKTQLDRRFPASAYSFDADYGQSPYDGPTSTLLFENFVIGDSNRMAYSMAVSVAEMPGGTPLNPLFIYGKSGLGKTHLMRAIQNYIRETQPWLRTVYVDSAELLSEYTAASAAHDKEKTSFKNFKTRYEQADVLLIDDIQYFQGKKQTLEIVFQIFNKLTDQGKQIVLSADRAPKNIDIDERYHSRFNQGGTIDIQPPEIETKLGIVKSFINEYKRNEGLEHLKIPEPVQMYIAENSSSNIRELKSAVTKVIYQALFFNQPDMSVSDVRSLLENHFSSGTAKNLTVEDIQNEVCTFFKVSRTDMIGPKRARSIVYPRQIAIYLCRQMLDLPFNDIGKKFNRDHSTAMHSVTTVEEMMKKSREVQEEIEALKQIIREL